jgi:hypothetical protein
MLSAAPLLDLLGLTQWAIAYDFPLVLRRAIFFQRLYTFGIRKEDDWRQILTK